jgi:glycine cleavage system H lipoate-binding protein
MKVYTTDNKYWIEEEGDNARVGLSETYLDKLGLIWSFIGKDDLKEIQPGQPFANIESSKRLGTLRSPIKGTILDMPATDIHPESITSETTLFIARIK